MKPVAKAQNGERPIRLTAREAACRAIADVLERRGFVSAALQRMQVRGLRGRDAALAAEIGLGTVRHLITLEHVLGRVAAYHPRHAAPRLRAVLAAAAYQLIWLDRVPEFAAVDEAVTLARRFCGGGAGRMANAVLRKLSSAIETRRTEWTPLSTSQIRVNWMQACSFRVPVLPEADDGPHVAHLAAVTGERPRRLQQLVDMFGDAAAAGISWASQAIPPVVLHPNSLRLNKEDAAARLRAAFGAEVVHDADGRGFMFGQGALANMSLIEDGSFFVQDVTANECAAAIPLAPGMRVLDLCAAPGGKSVALGLALRDQGEIIACDTDQRRIGWVGENARRMGLHCVRSTLIRPDDSLESFGDFDVALVDAPCSNSGVIARRPEARLGLTDDKLASLNELQMRLLEKAALRIRRDGALVYSTCSIEPRENAELVRTFLAENAGWQLGLERLTLPRWTENPADWRDGGFVAVLRRA